MKAAISVHQLGKKYHIGHQTHNTLRDQMAAWLRPRKRDEVEDFWAVKNVSFEIHGGEVVGIIGRNGAGKSTLLKILSQITEPTEGEVRIRGRVASLLEVGTGFHPELSGRENVFLNGAILGMTRREIRAKFDEIVAFSEVDRFIDTPVKHYSSGMYVRLAFAVAAHLEPEILIVDEVLAVGDGAFQRKCLGKMGDISKSGRTILFVSHNLTAVRSLCTKGLMLQGGKLVAEGSADDVVRRYLHETSGAGSGANQWTASAGDRLPGTVRLEQVRIVPRGDASVLDVHTPVDLEFSFWNGRPGAVLNVSLFLYTEDETLVFNHASPRKECAEGMTRAVCHIPGNFLNDNTYRVRAMIVEQGRIHIDEAQLLTLEVVEGQRSSFWHGKWPGALRPQFEWEINSASVSASPNCNSVVVPECNE